MAYAEAVDKIGVKESVKFIGRAKRIASFKFEMIQTDHGSEFSTWFTHTMQRIGIVHRHSRVQQSNDNAHIERFNRTIQEECLDRMPYTISRYRTAIIECLSYYNTERLHMEINFKTPLEVMQKC